MTVLRVFLIAVAAVAVSAAVIAGAEAAAHALVPGRARFAAVAIGYGLGALAGSTVAGAFGAGRVAIAVTLLLGLLAILNLFSFPHPWWFTPLAALTLPLGWLGGRRLGRTIGSRRTAAA